MNNSLVASLAVQASSNHSPATPFLLATMTWEFFSLETIQTWASQYGYWLIFFGIMLENAGIPLPGETITLVGGFLAGSGELEYPLVLLCAISGAIVGDSCGYWLGRWGGMQVLEGASRLFRLPLTEVYTAREKFGHNADRAVFFGRFIALLRIFAGPLAGLSGMPYPRFLFFNAAGAVLWAVLITGLAYETGNLIPLEALVTYVLRFGVAALGGVGLWLCVPLVRRFLHRKSPSPLDRAPERDPVAVETGGRKPQRVDVEVQAPQ